MVMVEVIKTEFQKVKYLETVTETSTITNYNMGFMFLGTFITHPKNKESHIVQTEDGTLDRIISNNEKLQENQDYKIKIRKFLGKELSKRVVQ
jgi:hypothetical protein